MIPIKYNIRSLTVRWVTTLQTVLAIAIVVFASILTFGMIEGINNAFKASGDKDDLIVMRQGSNDEMSSTIAPQVARDLLNLEGVGTDADGKPMAAREFVTVLIQKRRDQDATANIIVRGTEPASRGLRKDFKIVAGRDLEPGVNELIASTKMADRFEGVGLGDVTEINKVNFTVVGLFEAGGSSAESEVWADLGDLNAAQRFDGAVSVINMRVPNEATRDALIKRVQESDQFKLDCKTEESYFANIQSSSSLALKAIAYIIAFFLTIGAMFAAANTMYAAVASRGREIGTLRALGFSRRTVLTSFIAESLVICLLGGLLGCLATLPLNGLTGGTQASTFSEVAFDFSFGPKVLAYGMILALAMGLIGGLFPALKAIRLRIVNALRQR
jgi:putative ABC transport system permease protein